MSSVGGSLHVDSEAHTAVREVTATTAPDLATSSHVIQSAPSPSNQIKVSAQEDAVGHDSSHLLQHPDASSLDSTAAVQQISDNREPSYTRQEATTSQIRQVPENSTITSLKLEHSSRTQSPLRESSVSVPSTEMAGPSAPAAPPKRSHHKKKGVAAAATPKRSAAAGPAKRSHKKKVVASSTATPAQSSPAPRSVRTASSPPSSSPDADGNGDQHFSGEEGEEEEEGEPVSDSELYCLCRKPDTGTFMIGCDGGCDDWFHGKCVNIAERWKALIDKYICPRCTEQGVGETTWKRMCRREGCGLPAMVSKGTKYCSDRCGQLFYQEVLAERTRQRQAAEAASKSKKGPQAAPEDLGARGGLISAYELKSLTTVATTPETFKSINTGFVSPVPTSASPTANETTEDTSLSHESALNDIERERIDQLTQLKETARARHSLLKDRAKFVAMLKTVASRLADHRNVKPKELCGFDTRLCWGEDEFETWRCSDAGQEALRIESLPLPSFEDGDGDVGMTGADTTADQQQQTTCTKKRCGRHYDWAKLHIDDTRFEISINMDFIKSLEREEVEIVERARLRAREIRAGGVGGTVEFHGLGMLVSPREEKKEDEEALHHDGHPRDVEMEVEAEAEAEETKGRDVQVRDVEAEEERQQGQQRQQDDDDDDDDDAGEEDKEVDMVDAIAASI